MSDFVLLHTDSSGGGGLAPTYHVAVGIGQSGDCSWTKNATVMGHDCTDGLEWDHIIDRLQKSLEEVRRQGHAKLSKNRSSYGFRKIL